MIQVAGGFDDISEEGSYEFANMKVTSNGETEFTTVGHEPTEMSIRLLLLCGNTKKQRLKVFTWYLHWLIMVSFASPLALRLQT
jgi:hypothetical protein